MRIPLGRIGLLILGVAATTATAAAQGQGPCQQIRAACEGAGFVQGAARDGMGLQVHCIMPIMQARPQPLRARLPLPKVDPQLVADCRARNARFGQPPGSAAWLPPAPGLTPPNAIPPPAPGGREAAAPSPSQPYPGQPYPADAPRPPKQMGEQRGLFSALPPEDQPETGPAKALPPQFRRTLIDYQTKEPAGTIIIDTPHTYLSCCSATARPYATASA